MLNNIQKKKPDTGERKCYTLKHDFEHVAPELPFEPKKHVCGDWDSSE